jgi:hypothetical protein
MTPEELEAIRQVMRERESFTPEQILIVLQQAGLRDENGDVPEYYRNTESP